MMGAGRFGHMATDGAWADKYSRAGHWGMFAGDRESDGLFLLGGLLHLVIWALVVALLVVLIRYFWKMGDKIK